MAKLSGIRVAAVATDGTEEAELVDTVAALRNEGAKVDILSLQAGEIQCFKHHDKSSRVKVDALVANANPEDYDALLLPGGALNADALRVDPFVKRFVQPMDAAQKAIAVIFHAPWILISTCLVNGRTLTSLPTIEDDIRNAGGHWVDREVALDANWVSSRKPAYIPAFNREMVTTFAAFSRNSAAQAPVAQ